MTQVARPATDISTGNWMPTPVYAEIDEVIPDDGTYVSSDGEPEGDTFIVSLSPVDFPGDEPQILRVRLRKTNTNDTRATIVLLQGISPVAAWDVTPPEVYTTYEFTLAEEQVQRITDYTDLRLRVTASAAGNQVCVAFQISSPEPVGGNYYINHYGTIQDDWGLVAQLVNEEVDWSVYVTKNGVQDGDAIVFSGQLDWILLNGVTQGPCGE